MILIDANLLIYSVDADSAHHAASRRWLEATLSGTERIGFAWVVVLAFLRITTRPGILHRQLQPDSALAYVDGWLRQPCAKVVVPGESHWSILRALLLGTGTAGNLTTDAHLAALAVEHGATLCSTDGDYARFHGVVYENPIASKR